MVFNIWGEKSNAPVQGLHAAWGLGHAFGPLLIRPFLGPDRQDETMNESDITGNFSNGSLSNGTSIKESRIEIAYLISALVFLLLAVAAFIFQWYGVPRGVILHIKQKESFRSVFSVRKLAGGDRTFGFQMLILFGIFFFGNSGREDILIQWLFSYAIYSELDFSKQEAALLDAAAKFCFMAGRMLAAVLALKIPIQPMLFVEVSQNLVINLAHGKVLIHEIVIYIPE